MDKILFYDNNINRRLVDINYYNEIKEKLLKSEIFDKAKDYAKDRNKVKVYFETGKLLSKAGKEYGKNIIKQYSERLMVEVGKRYNERTLYGMRKFYEVFSNEKLNPVGSKLYPVGTKLSWSHYRELLIVKNIDAIMYYIDVCERNNLTKRQLQERIKSKEYERLSEKTKIKLINKEKLKVDDLIPNPIIIKSNLLEEEITEYALKQLILNNIDDFLRQLGVGYTYVGNEYKIKIGNEYNYIDLLLFNYIFNCFVVIELKITKLKKEHLGQIQVYMNYIDNSIKSINHDDTIGIIICRKDNKFVMEYCSDKRVLSREYNLV